MEMNQYKKMHHGLGGVFSLAGRLAWWRVRSASHCGPAPSAPQSPPDHQPVATENLDQVRKGRDQAKPTRMTSKDQTENYRALRLEGNSFKPRLPSHLFLLHQPFPPFHLLNHLLSTPSLLRTICQDFPTCFSPACSLILSFTSILSPALLITISSLSHSNHFFCSGSCKQLTCNQSLILSVSLSPFSARLPAAHLFLTLCCVWR